MKNLICRLFGHKHFNDSGWHACTRCGMHSYYHGSEYWNDAVLLKPIWFVKRKLFQLKDIIQAKRKLVDSDELPF